jgi:hypothetical protein
MSDLSTVFVIGGFALSVFSIGMVLGKRFVDRMLLTERTEVDPNRPITITIAPRKIREKQPA